MKLETLHEVKYAGKRTLDNLLHFFDEHDYGAEDDFGEKLLTYYPRDGFMVINDDEVGTNRIQNILVNPKDQRHVQIEYIDSETYTYRTEVLMKLVQVHKTQRVF